MAEQDHPFPHPPSLAERFFQPVKLRLANGPVPGWRAVGQFPVNRLGRPVSRITGRIGVQADVVAVQRNEAIPVITKLVVPGFEAKRRGHPGLEVISHLEVVITEDVVMVGLEIVIDRRHVRKALEVAVDEVAEVHDELQVEAVQVLNTRRQFFWRQRVLTRRRLRHLDIAVLAVGNHAEGKERPAAALGQHRTVPAKPDAEAHRLSQPDDMPLHRLTRSLLYSCIHNMSGLSGVEMLSFNSRPLVSGGIVRESSHLWISECPSAKAIPAALLWYEAG